VATVTKIFTVPTLALADDAGGPTALRAMKFGVDVVTNTQILNRGGPVYMLNTDQRLLVGALPSVMTSTQWNTFFDDVVAHPRRHKFDVNDFNEPRHSFGHIVDDPAYNNFSENKGVLSLDGFMQHVSIYPGGAPAPRPMSTIIYLLEGTSSAQVMTFTPCAHFYSRWPLSSVAGQAQQPIPIAPLDVVNKMQSDAISHSRSAPLMSNAQERLIGSFAAPSLRTMSSLAGHAGTAISLARTAAQIFRPR